MRDMKIRKLSLIFVTMLLGFLSSAVAGKDIYKFVDKDGNITFTNRPVRNAQRINIASYSRNTGTVITQRSSTASASTASTPSVKNNTQKERDGTRRQILEKELHSENKLLFDTQQSLSQMSKNDENFQDDKVVQLKNKLYLHQRNISALKKELSK